MPVLDLGKLNLKGSSSAIMLFSLFNSASLSLFIFQSISIFWLSDPIRFYFQICASKKFWPYHCLPNLSPSSHCPSSGGLIYHFPPCDKPLHMSLPNLKSPAFERWHIVSTSPVELIHHIIFFLSILIYVKWKNTAQKLQVGEPECILIPGLKLQRHILHLVSLHLVVHSYSLIPLLMN